MAAPSQGSYLTPSGHIMPAYSGRGRPPLNPQHSTAVSIDHCFCDIVTVYIAFSEKDFYF